jgi:hypothetical protein
VTQNGPDDVYKVTLNVRTCSALDKSFAFSRLVSSPVRCQDYFEDESTDIRRVSGSDLWHQDVFSP